MKTILTLTGFLILSLAGTAKAEDQRNRPVYTPRVQQQHRPYTQLPSHHGPHWHQRGHFDGGEWVPNNSYPPYEGSFDTTDEGNDYYHRPNGNLSNLNQTQFGSLAAAIFFDGTGNNAVAGVGFAASLDDADERAIKNCEYNTGPVGCTVVFRFSQGNCGYISWAIGSYGFGSTENEAFLECFNRGGVCQMPIGGCSSH